MIAFRQLLHSRLPRWIVWLFILGFVGLLVLPALQPARGSRRSISKNNLKQLGLALHNYHDTYGCFPPAITYGPDGKPWHSWRVLILPGVEQEKLYKAYRFDEPWNGPHNRLLADKLTAYRDPQEWDWTVFHCPKDEAAPLTDATYLAVVGDRTMWPPHGASQRTDATDGPEKTLLIVEVADSGINWMEPRDLEFDKLRFTPGSMPWRGPHGMNKQHFWSRERTGTPGSLCLTVEGSVRYLQPGERPAQTRSLLLRDDGGPPPDARY